MYINNLIKKQIKLSAATLFLLLLFIFGTSYAVFKRSTSDTETQSVSMGDLNIAFSNANGDSLSSADAITLNDSSPMSDADGLTNENNLYTFVVNNNGSIAYEYTVSLIDNPDYLEGGVNYDEDITLLSHDYIRANLLGMQSGNAFTNETFTLGSKANGLIYTNVINPGESQQYTIRLWVADPSSFYVPNEAIGAKVYLNIKIEGYAGSGTKTYDFAYTGSEQTFTAPKSGYYKIEAWGASGGGTNGGNGAYTSGEIALNANEKLYLQIGGQGPANATVTNIGGYNGGGYSGNNAGANSYGGGGATDIRLSTGTWNNATGLRSRIMVSAGGAGATTGSTTKAGSAGGLTGYNGTSSDSTYNTSTYLPIGSNQTGVGFAYETTVRQGTFGYAIQSNTSGWGGGGGSGYYAGGNGFGTTGAGGSSYISGHTGCVAITSSSSTSARTGTSGGSCTTGTTDNLCSVHYSGKTFTNTVMIDGEGYSWTNVKGSLTQMPNPNGEYYSSGIGHTGNGYVKITYIRPINENEYEYSYTGSEQTFTVPKSGYYKIEAWGASGGGANGGNGAYTSGEIALNANEKLYLQIGGQGPANATVTNIGGYNGGGYSGNNAGANSYGGGGATDIRLSAGTWNNATGLRSRIMVSAGGAGATTGSTTKAGSAGGLTGYNGTASNSTYNTSTYLPIGSNQTGVGFAYETTARQGAFGYAIQSNTSGWGGGGGSGYYAGGNGIGTTGAGGSSFISGHTGCVAITSSSSTTPRTGTSGGSCTTGTSDNLCSVHYSGKTFTNTVMIDGAGYAWTNVKGALTQMPNPNGGYYSSGIGHTGNGYVKITYIRPLDEDVTSFAYTGSEQTFIAPKSGYYKIEAWGASGGYGYNGGYTSGDIELTKNDYLYFYIGGSGTEYDTTGIGGYNGGGNVNSTPSGKNGSSGGGGTDVRLINGNWSNVDSLRSRIMVAGGGGGTTNAPYSAGGGLVGYDGEPSNYQYYANIGKGATQISGGTAPTKYTTAASNGTAGSFGAGGIGGASISTADTGGGSGGGGGYYGGSGASGLSNGIWGGGGGSSFISGHTGCVAIVSSSSTTPRTGTSGGSCTTGTSDNLCSVHYSGKTFTNTVMIDGAGYSWTNVKGALTQMPTPFGGYYGSGVGHTGNGFAKITYLGE